MIKKCFLVIIFTFVTLLPLKAQEVDLKGEYSFIKSEGISFFYKPNQEVLYEEQLTQLIKQNKTHLKYRDLSKIHLKANHQAKKEVVFKIWDSNTSIAPMIFDSVIYVKNIGDTNLINKRFLVDIKMKRGQLKEDPLILNKREVLKKTAVWNFYKSLDYTIPVLAPQEIGEIRVKDICLTDMMIEGVNIWPESIAITVREIDKEGNLAEDYLDYRILEFNPNKFQVLPFWH